MRQWIGSHLTFANVVSLAALFVALGGTATAVTYVVSSNSQPATPTPLPSSAASSAAVRRARLRPR